MTPTLAAAISLARRWASAAPWKTKRTEVLCKDSASALSSRRVAICEEMRNRKGQPRKHAYIEEDREQTYLIGRVNLENQRRVSGDDRDESFLERSESYLTSVLLSLKKTTKERDLKRDGSSGVTDGDGESSFSINHSARGETVLSSEGDESVVAYGRENRDECQIFETTKRGRRADEKSAPVMKLSFAKGREIDFVIPARTSMSWNDTRRGITRTTY